MLNRKAQNIIEYVLLFFNCHGCDYCYKQIYFTFDERQTKTGAGRIVL